VRFFPGLVRAAMFRSVRWHPRLFPLGLPLYVAEGAAVWPVPWVRSAALGAQKAAALVVAAVGVGSCG